MSISLPRFGTLSAIISVNNFLPHSLFWKLQVFQHLFFCWNPVDLSPASFTLYSLLLILLQSLIHTLLSSIHFTLLQMPYCIFHFTHWVLQPQNFHWGLFFFYDFFFFGKILFGSCNFFQSFTELAEFSCSSEFLQSSYFEFLNQLDHKFHAFEFNFGGVTSVLPLSLMARVLGLSCSLWLCVAALIFMVADTSLNPCKLPWERVFELRTSGGQWGR